MLLKLPLETMSAVYPSFLGGMNLGKGTFQQQPIENLSTLNEILKWKLKVLTPQTSSGYLSRVYYPCVNLFPLVNSESCEGIWQSLSYNLILSFSRQCCAMRSVRLNF